MRVGFISPLTVSLPDLEQPDEETAQTLAARMPLGILTLASIVRDRGHDVRLLDLNHLLWKYQSETSDHGEFCDFVARRIEEQRFEVLGLGTICSSFPLTLRIASSCRRSDSNLRIVLGGPQASVVDVDVLKAFTAVDVVVRGEAEESLPRVLEAFESGQTTSLDTIPGITYRRKDRVVRTQAPDTPTNLHLLPFPAYDLFPLVDSAKILPVELGRGCPYACTFCSTNDFFRRRFRLRSPDQTLHHMERLHTAYGVRHFELVHDMFTVDRRKVIEFCEVMATSSVPFFWNCSARTDRVDAELLDVMQRSGCRGIFFGIETGSKSLQKTIRKRLDLDEAYDVVRQTSDRGITAITSLIVGFPTETEEDINTTANALVSFLEFDKAHPQLHLLSPLAGTPIHREYANQLRLQNASSDISSHSSLTDADKALVQQLPQIFPNFYSVPCKVPMWELKALRDAVTVGLRGWRSFIVGLNRIHSIFELAKDYHRCQGETGPEKAIDAESFSAYLLERFHGSPRLPVVHTISSIWCAANSALDSSHEICDYQPPSNRHLNPSHVPVLAAGTAVLEIPLDYLSLKRWIDGVTAIDEIVKGPQWLSIRIQDSDAATVSVLSDTGKDLLSMCDGNRTIGEIASMRVVRGDGLDTSETLMAFELLRETGFVS